MGGDTTLQSPLRGASGVRAEHLKRWLAMARKSEKENTEKEVATTTEKAGIIENS